MLGEALSGLVATAAQVEGMAKTTLGAETDATVEFGGMFRHKLIYYMCWFGQKKMLEG